MTPNDEVRTPYPKIALEIRRVKTLTADVLDEANRDDADAELILFVLDEIQSSVGKMRSHVEKHYTEHEEVSL